MKYFLSKKQKFLSVFFFTAYFVSLTFSTLWSSSHQEALDFSQFDFSDKGPKSYSLYYADLSLNPVQEQSINTVQNYLNQQLIKDESTLIVKPTLKKTQENNDANHQKKLVIYEKLINEKKVQVVRLYTIQKKYLNFF